MGEQQKYFSEFGEILLFIIGGIIFIGATLLVSRILRPDRPNPEKLATYESGEEPVGMGWMQFNIRFYVIALVFLLFEVELIFLFPWATVFARKELVNGTDGMWSKFTLIEMIIFIIVLAIGLIYAWVKGHLDWVKPHPHPTPFRSHVPEEMYKKINEKYK